MSPVTSHLKHVSRFFDNHGAVVGVFLVTGIALACLTVLVFFLCRRRRSRRRGHRLEGRSPTLPQDPFLDPTDEALMSESNGTGAYWRTRPISYHEGVPAIARPEPAHQPRTIVDNTGVGAGGNDPRHYEGPFSDYYQMRPIMPYGVSTETVHTNARAHSRAQSVPSLYPPSLPDDEVDSLYEKEIRASHPPPPRSSLVIASSQYEPLEKAPIPKSSQNQNTPFRGKAMDYEPPPLTPTSSSSHAQTYSPLDSPASETGTNLTSILDEKLHRIPIPQTPPEAFLRRTFSKRTGLNVCNVYVIYIAVLTASLYHQVSALQRS